ncbi:MAG: divalent metal cation transporter [Opitutaceae bacterium]|nr:divalent metal cation transporter [Opitutaceae bacterium]
MSKSNHSDHTGKPKKIWSSLGPGILFAGAAIGVSHLVQSTRAGAVFGLGLLGIVIFANLFKYAAFRFGPHYAATTGQTLVRGYRLRGRWTVAVFGVAMLLSCIIIMAAVGITTSGLVNAVFGINLPMQFVAAILVAAAAILLWFGGYKILSKLSKIFVAILTITTFIATILVLPQVDWTFYPPSAPPLTLASFGFIIALMGFMPSPVELSVLTSTWSVAQQKETGHRATTKEWVLDFNIGFLGSALLAICFLIMGAGVMHAQNVVPEDNAVRFAAQIIDLYKATLGEWSGLVVGISALMVMITTVLTVLDGYARVLVEVVREWRYEPTASPPSSREEANVLLVFLLIIPFGAALILLFLMGSFQEFIDFTTIISFIIGPFIAFLNHISINGPEVPIELRPARWLNIWSIVGICIMTSFTAAYLFARFIWGIG